MRRLLAFVLILASLYALGWAVAVARVPGAEDIAFPGGRGQCRHSDWIELVQLVPALLALVLGVRALLRGSWPVAALILLAGWVWLMGAAECGIAYDE